MMVSASNSASYDPLSIGSGDANNSSDNNIDETEEDLNAPPLDQKVLEIVKACPDRSSNNDVDGYTIKPARLSAELGLSVEDATAELCGLMAAVGGGHKGASFSFETDNTSKVSTMVFYFPSNFEQRAKQQRRKEDFKQVCWATLLYAFKILKVVTAFGLILSLCILTIAAIIGIVVAIVAMSANNNGNSGHHQRNMLLRQLRSLFFTIRQMLFLYALWGDHNEGQDPFWGEIAYDLALLSSVCCVNPGSFFWWYRVQQLHRRRRRAQRGWGRGLWNLSSGMQNDNRDNTFREFDSDVPGIRLARHGDWRQEQQQQQQQQQQDLDSRGLLSIAVEFLFGPSPFEPGPSESDKWKLRAAVIVQLSAKNEAAGKAGVSLHQLGPYIDFPPTSTLGEDASCVLPIVVHFNGVPSSPTDGNSGDANPLMSRFFFPELLAESQFATRYDGSVLEEEDDIVSWRSLLCAGGDTNSLGRTLLRRTGESIELPMYLVERSFKFTKLETNQFLYCTFLGLLNLVGVIWLRNSLEPPNGMLQIQDGTLLATVIKGGLMRVLSFYAVLFFMLPAGRLLLVVFLNSRRRRRNERRKALASSLAELRH